jgi:hypothetical protein
LMMMVRLRLRGTELQRDFLGQPQRMGRMLSFQGVKVALMRQRYKEESQKQEQAKQTIYAGPGRAGKQRTSSALAMLGSGPAHQEFLIREYRL